MLLIILGTILNFYTNDVVIKRADSTIIPAIGMEVLDEDTIIAHDSSQAEILYADSSTLCIDENSRIVTSGVEKRSVFISVGRVWAKIKKLIKGESFEVKNPLSVSGITGTEFEVSYMDDESVVRVVEGKVNTQDRQTGREVVLQKERLARIRRNMEIEVKEFKLKELKKWYEWKKDNLEFLLRKIEQAFRQRRTIQASRLMAQGNVLAVRLNMTEEYKTRIEQLKSEYHESERKQGLIEKRLDDINLSYRHIFSTLSRTEPRLTELSLKVKRLSLQEAELEGYIRKNNPLIAKQQLNIVNRQIEEIEYLIKEIKPQTIYKWQKKLDDNYQFLQNAQKMPGLDARTRGRIQVTSKNVGDLRERVRRGKISLVKDMNTFRKLKLEIVKLKIGAVQR
jgi:hypothetical protein